MKQLKTLLFGLLITLGFASCVVAVPGRPYGYGGYRSGGAYYRPHYHGHYHGGYRSAPVRNYAPRRAARPQQIYR